MDAEVIHPWGCFPKWRFPQSENMNSSFFINLLEGAYATEPKESRNDGGGGMPSWLLPLHRSWKCGLCLLVTSFRR